MRGSVVSWVRSSDSRARASTKDWTRGEGTRSWLAALATIFQERPQASMPRTSRGNWERCRARRLDGRGTPRHRPWWGCGAGPGAPCRERGQRRPRTLSWPVDAGDEGVRSDGPSPALQLGGATTQATGDLHREPLQLVEKLLILEGIADNRNPGARTGAVAGLSTGGGHLHGVAHIPTALPTAASTSIRGPRRSVSAMRT
jgi:hypothetical protein